MRTFRDAGISGDFVHTRLQDAKNQIRLVHIKPSDKSDDKIECTISTHNLSDVIPFAAISYTWGNMASMHDIWLENKRLSIGENSRLVLWQARLHRCPLPLWIDVLSIKLGCREPIEKVQHPPRPPPSLALHGGQPRRRRRRARAVHAHAHG